MHGRHRAREAFRQAVSLPSQVGSWIATVDATEQGQQPPSRSAKADHPGVSVLEGHEKSARPGTSSGTRIGWRAFSPMPTAVADKQTMLLSLHGQMPSPITPARGFRTPASVRRNGCCALPLPSHREHWNANPQQWNTPDRTEDAAEAHASACNRRHPDWSNQEGAQRQAVSDGSNTVIVLRRSVWPRRTPAQQRTWP